MPVAVKLDDYVIKFRGEKLSVIPGSSCTNLVLLSEADIPSGNMDAGKSGAEMKTYNHTKFSAKGLTSNSR